MGPFHPHHKPWSKIMETWFYLIHNHFICLSSCFTYIQRWGSYHLKWSTLLLSHCAPQPKLLSIYSIIIATTVNFSTISAIIFNFYHNNCDRYQFLPQILWPFSIFTIIILTIFIFYNNYCDHFQFLPQLLWPFSIFTTIIVTIFNFYHNYCDHWHTFSWIIFYHNVVIIVKIFFKGIVQSIYNAMLGTRAVQIWMQVASLLSSHMCYDKMSYLSEKNYLSTLKWHQT